MTIQDKKERVIIHKDKPYRNFSDNFFQALTILLHKEREFFETHKENRITEIERIKDGAIFSLWKDLPNGKSEWVIENLEKETSSIELDGIPDGFRITSTLYDEFKSSIEIINEKEKEQKGIKFWNELMLSSKKK